MKYLFLLVLLFSGCHSGQVEDNVDNIWINKKNIEANLSFLNRSKSRILYLENRLEKLQEINKNNIEYLSDKNRIDRIISYIDAYSKYTTIVKWSFDKGCVASQYCLSETELLRWELKMEKNND